MSRRHAGALVNHDAPASPEAIVIEDEARSALATALQTLPERARTALLLAATGYRGAEIAAMIGQLGLRDPHDDEQGSAPAPGPHRRLTSPYS